jgi:two-component system cell cycle sensor histidine kinase/response regulator CckA
MMRTPNADSFLPEPPHLRVLILEDSLRDAKLMVALLENHGYRVQFEVLSAEEAFRQHLEATAYDVIMADFELRDWTALDALEFLKRSGKDIPLIVVTGTLGDESAAECIKQGATDFILKDRPARLPAAVERALEERRLRAERKQAEAEKTRLVTAIEQSAEGVVITNTAGEIEYVNPAFSRMTGYAREEVLGQNPRILKSDKQNLPFYQQLWTTILKGDVWQGELVNRRKDGKLYSEDLRIAPVRDPSGQITHFIAIKQDVSERKQLEDQVRQSQKMEAVGRLAAGVAHDFNNLVTVINGYCEMVLNSVGSADPVRADLEEVVKAGNRAASLTRQLLAFSRQQVLAPRSLDLNAVVADLEKTLRRVIGEDIDLTIVPSQELEEVKADSTQIDQILLNLAANARDAMPQGGKLTIETSNVDLDAVYTQRHPAVPPGRYVMLAVSDTGIGMDAETQGHIFEPFFTTKEVGKGTGLGLATVYGIVRQSGGFVWVYSEPGRGTAFKIYLPSVIEPAKSVIPPPARESSSAGTETVLLVEDEKAVRDLANRILRAYGYQVLESNSPEDALQIAERYPRVIHLLLTDVVMPRISGPQLAGQIISMRPDLKVLYFSGYTANAIVDHGVLEKDIAFLSKPFTPAALAQKVRDVLDMARNQR